jgi:type II secretory pathway pseudopilin PulG
MGKNFSRKTIKYINKTLMLKGFTIVELIVSITLLVILGTISLMSYTSYMWWVRDTNRITELDNLNKLMSAYRLSKPLPEPENGVNVYWSWTTIIWIQWYAWNLVLSKMSYNEWWVDPLDKKYYTYYRTANKKFFQLVWFLEEKPDTIIKTWYKIGKIYALDEYKNRYPKVTWDKIWLLLDRNNNPIQEIDSIKSWSWINVTTTTWTYTSYLSNTEQVIWDKTVVSQMQTLAVNWWQWCNSMAWSIICEARLQHIMNLEVSWSFWVNWANATINVCWGTVTADSSWNFSTTRTYWSTCNDIAVVKPWYTCTTTVNWPFNLVTSFTSVAWNCT